MGNFDEFKLLDICMLVTWRKEFQLRYASQVTPLLPVFLFAPALTDK